MFSILVPIAVSADAHIAADIDRGEGDGSIGIAVIDDERDGLEAISLLLRTLGYRVYPGRSAAEACFAHAVEGNDKAPIDLVITDYRLEAGTTGLDAIKQMRAHLGHSVSAVILTGDTSPERLKEVAASGHLLLHKPVDAEQVRQAILQLCSPQMPAFSASHH
ncbi:response regulator [Rhizobium sp. BR 314]|uniref:response regulator n=1 Tax=Rhizobium sp. BR 314 TaxID=3040013 RepID=UPI0039BF49B9